MLGVPTFYMYLVETMLLCIAYRHDNNKCRVYALVFLNNLKNSINLIVILILLCIFASEIFPNNKINTTDMLQKVIVRTPKRGRDFQVLTADLYMNWLVPYFKHHPWVKGLVFNRSFETFDIVIEFECVNGLSSEYIRFANDLLCNYCLNNDCFIDYMNFQAV